MSQKTKPAETNTSPLFKEFAPILRTTEPKPLEERQLNLFLNGRFDTPRNFRIVIPCVVELQDYGIFQTEPGTLDKCSTSAGIGSEHDQIIERAEVHESKIKQEIRRTGKELTRKEEVINLADSTSAEEKKKGKQECHIPDAMCGKCIDCRLWGFAAAGGSETGQPSCVEVGTAYSIRQVDEILRYRIGNAVDENARHVREAFFTKEQAQPQVFFPYVVDLKDVNLDQLIYVLYSLYNANRTGALSSKGGIIEIRPLGLFFSYEMLFANLVLTKRAYDYLYNERKNTLKPKAMQLGWLGDIKAIEAKKAIEDVIAKEYAAATCPSWKLTKFDEFEKKCLAIFRDSTQLRALIERNREK